MYNTKIVNCDTELLEQQKKSLINEIVYGSNEKIRVFDLECGTGKTLTSEEALAKMVTETNRNALFVRMTKEQCRESARRINDLCKQQIAFVFNNEDVKEEERYEVQKQLYNYRVLCITHQKYLVLQSDKSNRKFFAKGRHTLVIDEFPNDIEKLSIDLNLFDKYKTILKVDTTMIGYYDEIILLLKDYLLANTNTQREFPKFEKVGILSKIDELKRLVRSNFNILEPFAENITVKAVCNHLDNIKEFYNRTCIYDNGTIYTTNSKYQRWLLDNNIILDASGDLQIAYKSDNGMYKLENLPAVLNHGKWIIYNLIANSTSAGKERIINYYDIVNQIIMDNEDCLVVCKKDELKYYDCEHKAYFGDLIGSNDYRDLKNVVVVHTPNLTDIDYILRYLIYYRDEIDKPNPKGRLIGNGLTSRWEFVSSKFEKIREKWIANEIYQAIKRVNRNMLHDTKCYMICNNTNAVNMVVEKLKNCTVKTIDDLNFEFNYSKRNEYIGKLKQNSYASKFIQLMAELLDRQHSELEDKDYKYRKKVICKYLNIDSANFSHQITSKTEVIEYCKQRNISLSGQFITLPQKS
ncbi:DEAD/DEAH box helicase family protein [Anaerovorax odorimutans]|uniref:DEAD/DEAH box helicase family protein n=1 Tax=Anaerovorax odorimutans TaxID=109327 RepID=UPI0003F79C2F|nr:DEAD/DEAH box helicase family protein [Anaerovorax odorimutans]